MRTVDDRLRAAANETREYAARQWPNPPIQVAASHRPRGWLAFAAAFAAVVIAFAALPWLMGLDGTDVASQPSPLPTPGITTTPDGSECSVSGAPVPKPVDDLPAAVAEMRTAIIESALSCDIDALIALAGPGFTTHFGGGDAESFRIWEQEGEGRLDTLFRVLDMSHGVEDDGQGGEIYVWPAAFAYDSWEAIPPEALDELSSLYTPAELDLISKLGVYGGWRTGIDESGDWMYFVAGD